eukprot:COSAG01_NODE_3846_length_5644_cov_48.943192_9_plen_45_part_00
MHLMVEMLYLLPYCTAWSSGLAWSSDWTRFSLSPLIYMHMFPFS